MQGHSSGKTRSRSRALVPVSRRLPPAAIRPRGVALEGPPPLPPSARRRKRGFWGLGIKIGGAVAAVCALALAGANILAPSSWVEARAEAWLKAHTGRDLAVNGATRLSFWPSPHIEITDAVITDPAAGAGAAELAIPKLDIELGFLDLAVAPSSIERIVMDRPVLALHADGGPKSGPQAAMGEQRTELAGATRALTRDDFAIEELLIRDGTVLVHSARRSKPRRFERVNAALAMPALAAPLTGQGQLNWKGKAVDLDFELTSVAALASQGSAQLQLAIDADIISARYEGDVTYAERLSGKGTLVSKTRSVRQFLAWLKGVSAAVPVTGDGEMTSAVDWTSDEIALSDVRFAQEAARGKGHARIDLTGPRPHIEGDFVLDELDLGPALALAGGAPQPPAPAAAQLASSTSGLSERGTNWFSTPTGPAPQVEQEVVPPPGQSDGLGTPRLLTPGPGVSQPSLTISMPQGAIDHVLANDHVMATKPPPGPDAPLFDADVDLDIRKAHLDTVRVGPGAVSLDFADGKLTAKLWHMAFYGGQGRGTLNVAVTDAVPSFTGDLRLEDVDTRSLLKDAVGVDRLGGQGKLTLNIAGRAGHWDAMALSLMGNGAFAIGEGAIDGIAAPALVSGLEAGTLDLRPAPDAVMPFSLLAGSFDINHGLATTSNLRLRSPSAHIDVDGVVNLPRESLDLLVNPGPVAKEQGGGVAAVTESLSPFRIEGSLTNPRIGTTTGPLMAGSSGTPKEIIIPGLVLRERGGTRSRSQLTDGGASTGQAPQPRALAPSFAIAPGDTGAPPTGRTAPLR